jgi:hypothetical protein
MASVSILALTDSPTEMEKPLDLFARSKLHDQPKLTPNSHRMSYFVASLKSVAIRYSSTAFPTPKIRSTRTGMQQELPSPQDIDR